MIESYIEELRSVRAAISRLTDSPYSSATISAGGGSKTYTTVNLQTLYARERELVALIANSHRGGLGISYPIFCGG